MTALAAGLLLGVAGSVHCVAMCGPLVLAVRHARDARGVALYHGARVAVYAALGLLAGVAGHAVSALGLGRALSVVGGVALVAIALRRMGVARGVGQGGRAARAIGRAMRLARERTAGRPRLAAMAAGALNALLPCGLVYAALAAAAATATVGGASGLMLAFGLGTIPALAALPLIARAFPSTWRSRLRLAAPAGLAIVGVMLIMRGMH